MTPAERLYSARKKLLAGEIQYGDFIEITDGVMADSEDHIALVNELLDIIEREEGTRETFTSPSSNGESNY